jgi:hypothetical protein
MDTSTQVRSQNQTFLGGFPWRLGGLAAKTGSLLLLLCIACTAKNSGEGPGTGPAGQAGVNAYCDTTCGRAMTCAEMASPPPDLSNCAIDCKTTLQGDQLHLLRADTLDAVSQCAAMIDCSGLRSMDDWNAALTKCRTDAFAATAPTGAAQSLCDKIAATTGICVQNVMGPGCIDTVKVYSDVTLNTLSACLDQTCDDQQACWTRALTP